MARRSSTAALQVQFTDTRYEQRRSHGIEIIMHSHACVFSASQEKTCFEKSRDICFARLAPLASSCHRGIAKTRRPLNAFIKAAEPHPAQTLLPMDGKASVFSPHPCPIFSGDGLEAEAAYHTRDEPSWALGLWLCSCNQCEPCCSTAAAAVKKQPHFHSP